MIAYEHWPYVPEAWRDINSQLDNKIAASPIVRPDDFTPREQRCIALASEDNNRADVSETLFLVEGTVKDHWENAGSKLKEYLAGRRDPALKAEAKNHMRLHRLVYVLPDSEVILVGTELPRAQLDIQEATYLKGLAAGTSSTQAGEWAGVKCWKLNHELLPPLKEKLGAFTLSGMIGNAYRMKLFVPRSFPLTPPKSTKNR